ncbi:MAG: 1-deoxy-D-xylulose-5-phosphate reductoisomerase [Bacteroidales bacterium]|nr:1-deoxy-D-xylulose-5-phosphate reductoisomerase [Bacteroidales bacterium]
MSNKRIAILGSTGSIGTQAIDVIVNNPEKFTAEVLVANTNSDLLIQQARMLEPNMVVIGDESKYTTVKEALSDIPVKVFAGKDSIRHAAAIGSVDLVLTAMVGFAGLEPCIQALEAGKVIALANKETLVVAGDLITRLSKMYQAPIIPVDSEHSAIFQCIIGEVSNSVEKLILTASGGPFRGKNRESLQDVTPEQALKHPNWTMGAKVTIDSASFMNKGLELIEAHWLFGLSPDEMEVIIHPQSIIHSMVQFCDGSVKAQLSPPDMRMPIHYAFAFPERVPSSFGRINFDSSLNLTFEKPDLVVFRNLAIAYEALRKGGNVPCAMNAANEVAVQAFLQRKTGFLQMSDIIEKTLEQTYFISSPDLTDYIETDKTARIIANELINKNKL